MNYFSIDGNPYHTDCRYVMPVPLGDKNTQILVSDSNLRLFLIAILRHPIHTGVFSLLVEHPLDAAKDFNIFDLENDNLDL